MSTSRITRFLVLAYAVTFGGTAAAQDIVLRPGSRIRIIAAAGAAVGATLGAAAGDAAATGLAWVQVPTEKLAGATISRNAKSADHLPQRAPRDVPLLVRLLMDVMHP